jgi:hypothetical protein
MQQPNLSWSESEYLFEKIRSNAGAKQHSQDDEVQQVLNLGHALRAFVEAALNALVPLGANGLMDTQSLVSIIREFLYIRHKRP